jgi:hypothetical protein
MADRPWKPPARHWPDRAHVTAGLDELAVGSWLGLNDDGLVASVLNRKGSLGPKPGKRSRGELVLEALEHADALAAAAALAGLEPASYRPFNMVIADNTEAYWLHHQGSGRIEVQAVSPGLSMLTAHEINDHDTSPRIQAYLPRFRAAPVPNPETGDWRAWEALMGGRAIDPEAGPRSAMTVITEGGYGTISSSLIALPGLDPEDRRPLWRFAAGRPGEVPYRAVAGF